MDRSTDNYLHKKFKKQLSVEPRGVAAVRNDDKENKIGQTAEEDNNKTTVPNYSTNHHHHHHHHHHNNNNSSNTNNNQTLTPLVVVVGASTKSSISTESEPCISTNDAQPTEENPAAPTTFDNSTFSSGGGNGNSAPTMVPDQAPTNNEYYNQNGHLLDEAGGSACATKEELTAVQIVPEKNANGKYVCHYCNLVCSKPSVLQKHIRAHTNERPFPCNSCGFSFKTRSNLYKHCRSRTHANRVMGVKAQQENAVGEPPEDKQSQQQQQQQQQQSCADNATRTQTYEATVVDGPTTTTTATTTVSNNNNNNNNNKPYKPRFHSSSGAASQTPEAEDERALIGSDLSHHINEIINKNNSIVNSTDSGLLKRRFSETLADGNEYAPQRAEEPLNLTNKNRKRCMSEATTVEPTVQKSLIKELLIKNLYSDPQCVYCKMIFGTVTELELHKLRNCKAKSSDAKHTRSNSVNVASILTKNKNAFDSMPQFQNMMFPLNSPGPFLGKTRLVESDKSKSFSFDAVNIPIPNAGEPTSSSSSSTTIAAYAMSPLSFREERKTPVRLFGGEVKVQDGSGETKSYRIDDGPRRDGGTVSENRVVKSNLQSGGTVVLSTKTARQHEESPHSFRETKNLFGYEPDDKEPPGPILSPPIKYPNLTDISMKLLTPKIKAPSLYSIRELSPTPKPTPAVVSSRTNLPALNISVEQPSEAVPPPKKSVIQKTTSICNPMNLLVNGKVIRYVPGMPGPVVAAADDIVTAGGRREGLSPMPPPVSLSSPRAIQKPPTPIAASEKASSSPEAPSKSIVDSASTNEPTTPIKKFVRPTSLALRPTTAASKQHHGLTPTVLTQILISPDTPRVAKKYAQHLFNGNYFSYLGLKSSTKFVYCTLNKTQPFYVPHFKKLSMYSEWRQQDTKTDKLYVSAYDSRQRNQRYTSAGKATADLIIHSSYKFAVSEVSSKSENEDENSKSNSLIGGYECSEDSPYVRGRGRGRYVCEQCGIRCKKPSMLKKHIRTHSNDRPYTCSHCNFSFKTKGNLTKHMKSKSHSKNYTATGSGSSSSTRMSGSQSSDYDTDDSGMDSSDESMTRSQEHEAAYGLLSLSQKTSVSTAAATELLSPSGIVRTDSPASSTDQFMTSEEIAHVSKTNYAKNKILDSRKFKPNKEIAEQITSGVETQFDNKEDENLSNYLGKTSTSRPLTYPYTSVLTGARSVDEAVESPPKVAIKDAEQPPPDPIQQFHVIQKYGNLRDERVPSIRPERIDKIASANHLPSLPIPTLKVNDVVVVPEEKAERKRKITVIENNYKPKVHRNDEVMDLSISSGEKWSRSNRFADYRNWSIEEENRHVEELNYRNLEMNRKLVQPVQQHQPQRQQQQQQQQYHQPVTSPLYHISIETLVYNHQDVEMHSSSSNETRPMEYDNSAMETLAEVATKQVKLDKNTLAKSVATEYLKLATQNENLDGNREATTNVVNDLIVKPEGSKSCALCSKSFTKPFQLKLHMNIHYLERPFRCESCSVSFRTKGHLQKHERSASHYSKLSSSPAQPSTEPRPFKCMDCNIAFRIHGHLAKHLRSKMHIMKLECLAKIPFGLYAELERSNSLLTEINTSDGDQCLESLKTLAKKVFVNDPGKLQVLLNEAEPGSNLDTDNT